MKHLILATTLLGCVASEGAPSEPVDAVAGPTGKGDTPFEEGGDLDWDAVARRCGAPTDDEAVVTRSDFRWDYNLEDMGRRFDEMYASGKRLAGRAYFDDSSGAFVIPILESWGARTVLSKRLVENVRMHLERALARGYAEYVFFPDMGHSHFFIPEERWESAYRGFSVPERGEMYAQMFDDPELRSLYHTAEQLTVLDEDDNLLPDRHLRWRFFTRNVVGDNNWGGQIDLLHEPTSSANTSRTLAGHHYYGAGFNITSTIDGCFPYLRDGGVSYFDISLKDLPSGRTGGALDL